jgi:hypothetical protein
LNGGQPWDTVVRAEEAEDLNLKTACPPWHDGSLVYLLFDILIKDLDRKTSSNPPRLEIYENDSSSVMYIEGFVK